MIYTLTLNPALDYTVYADKIASGRVNRSLKEELFYGGKGINVSVILNRLNVKSTALGFVAGFTGSELEKMLQNEGIITDFIRLKSGITRINIKLKADAETDINAIGPDIDDESLERLFEKIESLKTGDMLCISGSAPKSLPDDIYESVIKRIAEKDIRLVVDAEGELLLNTLSFKPFLIKPNHHELGAIFSRELKSADEIAECAAELQKRGAQNVLVSRAQDGALLLDSSGRVFTASAPNGKVINSVGAGDSMVAGFIAAVEKGMGFDEALRLGTACGSATAFSSGLADIEKIDKLYKEIKVL